jgi:hypothetical protein
MNLDIPQVFHHAPFSFRGRHTVSERFAADSKVAAEIEVHLSSPDVFECKTPIIPILWQTNIAIENGHL